MSNATNGALPVYPRPNFKNCQDGVTELCPVEASLYGDYFTLGACIFFVVAHAFAFVPQILLGVKAHTWSFTAWLGAGILFELIGYAARIAMTSDPWAYVPFVLQLVMLILGPTLVAASISITFKHMVLWYGRQYSPIKPVLYPWLFVGSDLVSIVIQAAGGIICSIAIGAEETNWDLLDAGSDLLLAGTSFQLANMVICGGFMLVYLRNRRRAIKYGTARLHTPCDDSGCQSGFSSPKEEPPMISESTEKKTKTYVYAISAAYVFVIIRCAYRVPEQKTGWGSDLMQNELTFLILDGAMMLIAVWILTIFHAHFFFPFLGKKPDCDTSSENILERRLSGHEMSSINDTL